MTRRRKTTGFTLTEILISLILLGLIVGGLTGVMYGALMTHIVNDAYASLSHTSRALSERLSREIRLAQDVQSEANPTTLRIFPADTSGADEIRYVFQDGVLYYQRVVGGSTSSYVLLDETSSVQPTGFTVDLKRVSGDSGMYTAMARVSLSLTCRDRNVTVTSSACPRMRLNE